jgi:hypothetical protein
MSRKFRIRYALGLGEEVNELMRKADLLWGDRYIDATTQTGIIETDTPLTVDEYGFLLREAFEANGGKLYDIGEQL